MSTRKEFLKTAGAISAGFLVSKQGLAGSFNSIGFESKRPPLADRHFTSEAVEAVINKVKAGLKNEELGWLFENCFPNTLDTTVDFSVLDGKPDTYVITGDID